MAITSGFNHVATLTTDLDRFAAWYGDVFGAEVTFSMEAEGDHPRMFIVDLGGGIDGYLRASELARDRVEDARAMLKVGDEVEAVGVGQRTVEQGGIRPVAGRQPSAHSHEALRAVSGQTDTAFCRLDPDSMIRWWRRYPAGAP